MKVDDPSSGLGGEEPGQWAIFRLRKEVEMTQERGTARAEPLSCPRAGSREQDVVALKVSLTTAWAGGGQALEEGWLLLFIHQT